MAVVAAAIAAVAAQLSSFHFIDSMILASDAASITATMIGTEITWLITAARYKALIGSRPAMPMPTPTNMAATRMQ